MKWIAVVAAVAASGPAWAGAYALVCAADCIAPDGTTQPAGTVLQAPITWDGHTLYVPPPGTELQPYTGQIPYLPPQPQQ